jgi:hypothetical protein
MIEQGRAAGKVRQGLCQRPSIVRGFGKGGLRSDSQKRISAPASSLKEN